MENSIHHLTNQFLGQLEASLSQHQSFDGEDSSLHILLHMVSCTRTLRDLFDRGQQKHKSNAGGNRSGIYSKFGLLAQLYQPFLNGLLSLFGKLLLDAFSVEPQPSGSTIICICILWVEFSHIILCFPLSMLHCNEFLIYPINVF